ncbi:iron uptake porin [Synechococcus sp. Cu2B8-bc1011]|uniref:iron uptake porin n=1 Tax=Synechococcus sp. Cu2B8-bc1011 TaxID=3093725 RepID=UPI0039AED013
MKLFHQLLVAPAALGLLAPVAANATDFNATELNINGVSDYAATSALSSREQVTSITQFSDVYPTDWAYQALSNLIERYGCVAGYPNGTYRGNRAMTRFEAAALLNACLDRVTEVTDELKRLMKEFEKELAILKGRVDGLEARVGELEATQFSTTTKLDVQASFVVGANNFGGDLNYSAKQINEIDQRFPDDGEGNRGSNLLLASGDAGQVDLTKSDYVNYAKKNFGATVFNYDIQMILNTSFTGKDLLTTTLRAGNFGSSSFNGGPTTLSTLEVASESDAGPNDVFIDKIFYNTPIGEDFTFFIGANVGQDDMLPLWPSAYPQGDASTVLDVLTLNGAPAAYNKNQGPGVALNWEKNGWTIGLQYVANLDNGPNSNPQEGGIATDNSAATGTVQIGYQSDQWAIAAIYSYIQDASIVPYSTSFTQLSYLQDIDQSVNAFGLSGYWQPISSGFIPAISVGWGINTTSFDGDSTPDGYVSTSQSWQVSLQWQDAFMKGNTAGLAVGQATFATDLTGSDSPDDGNYAWEGWYSFQVTDNITVTPALFYLSRPLGQLTPSNESFSQLGGLLRTTFTF